MDRTHNRKVCTCFNLFMVFMAVYYGLRMFFITPWYDELYTYYYFISRGPVYAAIHWPLPNNHIGYSVLSACLMFTGNSYAALRGVSYAAALFNILLLFRILRDAFSEKTALAAVIFYAGLGSVMRLAVQGRGYTLSVCCMLVMIRELQKISSGDTGPRDYAGLCMAAVYGLYTVPSSLYWAVPLFAAGGLILISGRKYRELKKLVMCGLISAGAVFILYSVIWLAVGSNLLVKDAGSAYYGETHFQVIRGAFFGAWKAGLDYMLASPYIQSLPGKGFAGRAMGWLLKEMTEMSGTDGVLTLVIVAVMFLVTSITIRRDHEKQRYPVFIADICFAGSLLMMVLQRKLPYYRVLSFWGVFISVWFAGTVSAVQKVSEGRDDTAKKPRTAAGNAAYMLLCATAAVVLCRSLPFAGSQYGAREAMAADALQKTYSSSYKRPAVTDCEPQYLMEFMYGIRCTDTGTDGCDYVIFDTDMISGGEKRWEYLTDHDSVDWKYVNGSMKEIYRNSDFAVYAVKDKDVNSNK
jgi:hypothetical protein